MGHHHKGWSRQENQHHSRDDPTAVEYLLGLLMVMALTIPAVVLVSQMM